MKHDVELASTQSFSNQLESSGLKFPVDDDMFKDVEFPSSGGPWKFNESTGSYSYPSGSYTTTT